MHVPSRGKLTVIAVLACLAAIVSVAPANGQLNFVPGPENAWAYYEGPSGHAGWGPNGHLWYPTSLDQFCPSVNPNVQFLGYVDYSLPQVPTEPGWWGGQGDVEYGMYHIFCTHVWSENDLEIPICFGGDDGSSLFFDGVFLGGVPFNQSFYTTLSLRANQWHTLILAGNNAMGPWNFGLNRTLDQLSIQSTPGVRIRASEHCIPEPSGLSALGVGLLTLFGVAVRPRIRFRR